MRASRLGIAGPIFGDGGRPRRAPVTRHPRPIGAPETVAPIEPCWSKLKGRLRTEPARSLDALDAALGPALATITAEDARGWFRHAGYPAPD